MTENATQMCNLGEFKYKDLQRKLASRLLIVAVLAKLCFGDYCCRRSIGCSCASTVRTSDAEFPPSFHSFHSFWPALDNHRPQAHKLATLSEKGNQQKHYPRECSRKSLRLFEFATNGSRTLGARPVFVAPWVLPTTLQTRLPNFAVPVACCPNGGLATLHTFSRLSL